MIAICPNCKSHKWNKTVDGNHIICPECGASWNFVKKSLYVIKDYFNQIEQIYNLSNNISQCGKSVVWTMTGNIDKLLQVYHARFFREIRVLALICSEETLRKRMTKERGITDEDWINSSIEYNEYFKTHQKIGKVTFSKINIDNKSPVEAAKCILKWITQHK